MSEAALAPGVSASRDARLANLVPYRDGASGNPSGRPKGQKGFAALIRRRSHQGRALLDVVFELMQDAAIDPRVRLDAASWLANRAYGPPAAELPELPDGVGRLTIRELVLERTAVDR